MTLLHPLAKSTAPAKLKTAEEIHALASPLTPEEGEGIAGGDKKIDEGAAAPCGSGATGGK